MKYYIFSIKCPINIFVDNIHDFLDSYGNPVIFKQVSVLSKFFLHGLSITLHSELGNIELYNILALSLLNPYFSSRGSFAATHVQ